MKTEIEMLEQIRNMSEDGALMCEIEQLILDFAQQQACEFAEYAQNENWLYFRITKRWHKQDNVLKSCTPAELYQQWKGEANNG